MQADDDEFDWVMAMMAMGWFDDDDKQSRDNSQPKLDNK